MTTLSGTLYVGGVAVNGALWLEVSQRAVGAGGANVTPSAPYVFALTAGQISGPGSAPYTVLGNDVLSPANTSYFVTAFGSSGEQLFRAQVSITGASADIGAFEAASTQVWVPPLDYPLAAHASTHQAGGSDPIGGTLDANARVAVAKTGVLVGTRRKINLLAGANVTITVTDDAGGEKVDVQIDAAAAAGAPSSSEYLVGAADAALSAERVITDTASVAWDKTTPGQAKANVQFGSVAGVACQGNDSRLSDARTPTAHTQAATTLTFTAGDKLAGRSSAGAGAGEEITCTPAGRALLAAADAAAQRMALGLGSAATLSEASLRSIPQNSQTAGYTLVAGDSGKHISITTGGVTVNASVFSAGDPVTIFNNSGSNQTITQGTNVTLRLAGTATTGNRTLAQYVFCTLLCVVGGANPVFAISGAGLS